MVDNKMVEEMLNAKAPPQGAYAEGNNEDGPADFSPATEDFEFVQTHTMGVRPTRYNNDTYSNLPALSSQEERANDNLWKSMWRPTVAWQYILVCLFDFIIFPAGTMILSAYTDIPYVAWQPITLVGGGLYHMAMGAICGVYAYGRTQEKKLGIE